MEESKIIEGQEQIQEQVKEKESKTYTEEELQKLLQSETDKRVTQALKTAQEKWQKEYEEKLAKEKLEAERLASMTAEEKKLEELAKKEKELAERETKIKRLELESQTKTEMASNGLPVEFTSYVMADTAEQVKENIATFKAQWEQAIEKAVNERLQGTTPKTATKIGKTITKEQFAKLGYKERMALYQEDPELYEQLQGN